MHRGMIAAFNQLLSSADDPQWPAVTGWSQIPWSSNDPDWPVPPDWPTMGPDFANMRTPGTVQQMQQIAAIITSPQYLRSRSLDQMGTDIEGSLHVFMHLRWSAEPAVALDLPDVANDWLGAPFSSHVNKHFWKLHGWIDDRVRDWAAANDKPADLSEAWSGPGGMMHNMPMDNLPRVAVSRSRASGNFRLDLATIDRVLNADR